MLNRLLDLFRTYSLREIYHFTNEKGYKKIISDNKILPMSQSFWRAELNKGKEREFLKSNGLDFQRIESLMNYPLYTVCFEKAVPKDWIDSGLMSDLLNHLEHKSTRKNYTGADIYSFKLVVNTKFLFVRDHYYLSPKYFIEKYNYNYWDDKVKKDYHKIPQLTESLVTYFNSTLPYYEYQKLKLKYKVPELWYAGEYQINPTTGIKKLSDNGISVLKSGK